jgi:hypothetical protein
MVDLIDETFIAAAPATVSAALHDPAVTREIWPDLTLTVFQDRAEAGVRWTATGGLVGSTEVWVEPWGDGALLHVYVRADITRRGSEIEPITGSPRRVARRAQRERQRRAWSHKRATWALKSQLEHGRAPGEPAAG